VAALEVLINNTRVRDMIIDGSRTADIRTVIEESDNIGMQNFDMALMDLFQSGQISEEEALENCSNIRDFQMRLEGVVSGKARSDVADYEPAGQAPIAPNLSGGPSIEIEGVRDYQEKLRKRKSGG
jgi:Tfp pilus assembly ATPase PilU